MKKEKDQGQSLLTGAATLMVTTVIVQLIGIFYKIPITSIIGTVGRGYFTSAYELYTPIYAISMAGLPVAVSKMVSERVATGRYREVRQIRHIARRIYLVTGLIGTAVLLLLAYPYTQFIHTPNAMMSVITIAPAILFCCMMSSYRGYYEGLRNMKPTGYSQVMEAFGKLVIGVLLALGVTKLGMSQFESTGVVFGKACKTAAEASSVIVPYSTAASMFGVTAGSILGLIYLQIRHRRLGDGITQEMLMKSPEPVGNKELSHKLIRFAIPVVTSSLILNVTNLIDSWTIQNRLYSAIAKGTDVVKAMYQTELTASHIMDSDIKDYLYGAYGTALDFRNIIPTMVMTLGLTSLPILSGAWAVKNKQKMEHTIQTVLKTSMLISVPSGCVLAALAYPILKILYIGSNAESSITISAPFVVIYGLFAFLLSISTPITNMLQAINRPDVPVKSMLVGCAVKIALNYLLVGTPSINIYGAPIGTIIFYVIIVSYNGTVLLKQTKVKLNFKETFLKPSVAGILAGISAYVFYHLFETILPEGQPGSRLSGFTLATFLALIIAIVIWLIALLALRVLTKENIRTLPKGEKIARVLEKHGLIR